MNKPKILKISGGIMMTVIVYIVYIFLFVHMSDNLHECHEAGEIPEPLSMLLVTAGGMIVFCRNRKSFKKNR